MEKEIYNRVYGPAERLRKGDAKQRNCSKLPNINKYIFILLIFVLLPLAMFLRVQTVGRPDVLMKQ
jgi:hypothetical protein